MADVRDEDARATPCGAKRPGRVKRVRRCLVAVLALGLLIFGAVSYNPLRTLASLQKVDDFPLYRMQYRGTYLLDWVAEKGMDRPLFRRLHRAVNPDACTSFVASTAKGDVLFGRNFDWAHKSSLLLYTAPSRGYASISMVDLYYLGWDGPSEIPWVKRLPLLAAPHAAIDGMNECGVAIAQNAVPPRETPQDPNKPTLLNSQIVRLVLDRARDVNDALALIQRYNVAFADVAVHFHIADASGDCAVVEYGEGGIAIVRGRERGQISTNYLLSEQNESDCWRYQKAFESIGDARAGTSFAEAMRLLQATSLSNTAWSAVYNLSSGDIRLVMGRNYDHVHVFQLAMKRREGQP
jgi:hypothetical protein